MTDRPNAQQGVDEMVRSMEWLLQVEADSR